jgi:DNA-binding NarL/FixJ family response regulator
MPVGGAEAAGGNEPSTDERTLLMLLAAGMKDSAIARQLRISERTANRRISELAERLDAHTRFQAGLQAARKGWL